MKNKENGKNKRMLLIVVLLAVLILFFAVLFLQKNPQDDRVEPGTQSLESSGDTRENSAELPETAADFTDSAQQPVYEEGRFTFTAGQFRERFADTLPEGYIFAGEVAANPAQNGKLQLDILDAAEKTTGIGVLLDTEEQDIALSQMALIIKDGGFREDAVVLLEWYLFTFLESFSPQEKTSANEEFLDMFDKRAGDYRLHLTDFQSVMMNRMEEDSGSYYYVMISIQ